MLRSITNQSVLVQSVTTMMNSAPCWLPAHGKITRTLAGGDGRGVDARPAAPPPVTRQQLRNELDTLVAHLHGLTAEFAHILGAFPLVFPDGRAWQGEAGGAAGGVRQDGCERIATVRVLM